MSKRINIVLPEIIIQTIDRMAKRGQRSRFINQAVQHFVAHRSTEALRTQLERAAVRDRDLDREVAQDWFAVDQEAWQRLDKLKPARKPATRGGENLPHGARPDGRLGDSENPASADHPKRRLKSAKRYHHRGAYHLDGAFST